MHPFLADQPDKHAFIHNAWQRGLDVLKPTPAQLQHGLELHRDAVALDAFGFLPMVWTRKVVDRLNALIDGFCGRQMYQFEGTRLRQLASTEDPEGEPGQEFVAALKASGLSGTATTVGAATVPGMNILEADVAAMSGFIHHCRVYRKHMTQAGSAAEILDAKKEGRFAIVWSCNSPPNPGRMIDGEDELANIAVWHRLGFRLMHITYNRRNVFADGGVEENDAGISAFGAELIKEMNRVGMIVDTPHSSVKTVIGAAKLSSKPVMCSHAGVRAIFDHHRNKSDEELKAIADTNGLYGVVGLSVFLGKDSNLNTLLDHVDYAVKKIGAEHVTIGTDNAASRPTPAEVKPLPKGIFNPAWAGGWAPGSLVFANHDEDRSGSLAWTNWPLYTVGLVMRGYSDDQIRAIIGGNLLRVLEANRVKAEAIPLA